MTPRLMRVSSKMLFLAVTTAGFNLPAEPLPDTAASTNLFSHAMMVKAEVRHEGGPGLMLADRAYLAAGTNRFAFLIPPELRLQVVEQRRVQLFTADYSLLLTVQVLDRPSPGTPQLDVNVSREHILKEYPGAKILSQSAPTVCGREGLGFEFEWIADGNLARRSRVVLAGTSAGMLELSVSSSPEQFESALLGFNTLLLTLVASEPGGKLNVAPISGML